MNGRAQLLTGVVVGILIGCVLATAGSLTTKRALFAGAALVAMLVLGISRRRERICIAAVIVLIPLNINYFLFGLYALHIGGATGLYLVPLDFPLAFLYANWFLKKALGQDLDTNRRLPRIALFFLPFLTIAALSVLYSLNSSWASYELLRWVRFALITVYFGYRIAPADLPFCYVSLAAASLLQAGIAVCQTVFRSNFGMDRLGVTGKGSEDVFVQELAATSTMVRGAGTSGHPNILAPFLVLTIFIFVLFALTEKERKRRLAWFGACAIILSGLVATLSRSSWVSFAIAAAVALALGIVWRLLTVQRAIVFAFVGVLLAGIGIAPFIGKLQERWRVGFTEAIEFRKDLNQTALSMIRDHPFGGVGLNNFTIAYPNYDPDRAELLEREWGTLPVVHNLYLLVWSELGSLGLLALLGFWVAVYTYAFRLLRELSVSGRAFVIGSLSGILGLLISDLTSFAFWTEVVMYTSAVLFGLFETIRVRDTAWRQM